MKELHIPKADGEKWNKLMQQGTVDLDDLKLPQNACVAKWTAVFGDGVEADLKVCTSADDVWCEMVWFKNGSQIGCTDVCDALDGPWQFDVFEVDDMYAIEVIFD